MLFIQKIIYICIRMLLFDRIINRKLSVQISAKVVLAIALLLTIALFVMLTFSREAVTKEAHHNAEHTLEYTARQIDNVLLDVEQASGNIYWDLLTHLDNPDRMTKYCEELVHACPFIAGSTIAFEPDYYKEKGQLFMTYVHRSYDDRLGNEDTPLIHRTSFGMKPYTEQSWYRQPIDSGRPVWIDPLKNEDAEGVAITSFCMPIYGKEGRRVGVLAVDVTLSLLSKIVLTAKTSPNSYAVLLGSDGSYIVHPDKHKIEHQSVYNVADADPALREAAEAVMSDETGFKAFRIHGVDSYVFYKPFVRSVVPGRSLDDAGWHIGLVYPKREIYGDYYMVIGIIVLIGVIGLIILFIGCRMVTHRQLLPLRMLSDSAQRISEGNYNDVIPDTRQQDEVGTLQNHFQQMQQALSVHVGELERLTNRLRKQGDVLSKSYDRMKEADRVKTAFLHHMTDQMIPPVSKIESDVESLEAHVTDQQEEGIASLVQEIDEQGKVVTGLLNHLLEVSQAKEKEDDV